MDQNARRQLASQCFCLLAVLATMLGVISCGRATDRSEAPQPLYPGLHRDMTHCYAALDRNPAPGSRLVFLGDSITDRMQIEEFWPEGGRRVLNRSIGGETVAGALSRVAQGLPAKTTVVIVMLGINDLAQGADPVRTGERLVDLVTAIRHQGEPLVVIESVLPATVAPAPAIVAVNERLARLAAITDGVEFLDLHGPFDDHADVESPLFSDGVHLSQPGCRLRYQLEREFLSACPVELDWLDTAP